METQYVLIIFSKEALEQIKQGRTKLPRVNQVEIWDIEDYEGDDMETFQTYPHTIIPLDDKVLPVQHMKAIHWLLDTDYMYGEPTLRETIQNLITLALNIPPQPQVLPE